MSKVEAKTRNAKKKIENENKQANVIQIDSSPE